MKLVIDIPEWKYKSVCEGVEASKRCGVVGMDPDIHEAIQNGTPLPKGYGRLIDADKLEPDYDWSEYETDTGQLMVYGYQAYSTIQIESAPTILEADKTESEDNG